MKTQDFLNEFAGEKKPIISAAAFIGVYPGTIRAWGKVVPEKWAYMIASKLNIDLEAGDYENTTKPRPKTKSKKN